MNHRHTIGPAQFQALAEFRYQIRRFLHFSESAARAQGLEPHQHQVMLAIKGHGTPRPGPSVSHLAERLQIRHNSAVELIDRMEAGGLVSRRPGIDDKRQVLIGLTAAGEKLLAKLSEEHLSELSQTGPALVRALQPLVSDEVSE